MTKTQANAITGGLSRPSKMPGKAFSLPAAECNVGSQLRKVPGSVCAACYACKGRYIFGNVQRALYRRLRALLAVLDSGRGSAPWVEWIQAMQTLIGADTHFRFHDSGDLQNFAHLALYCDLGRRMTATKFWLPTKETKLVRQFDASNIPPNLLIRLSASMVDGPVPAGGWCSSAVWSRDMLNGTDCRELVPLTAAGPVTLCPAATQGNQCGECRACWDPTVTTVVYPKH